MGRSALEVADSFRVHRPHLSKRWSWRIAVTTTSSC